jgi:hypothetical protein
MITNKMKTVQLKMREARFWPKMKFEPIFFRFFGSFSIRKGRFCGRAEGGSGGFRLPYKFWAKSVRIFSNAHRLY